MNKHRSNTIQQLRIRFTPHDYLVNKKEQISLRILFFKSGQKALQHFLQFLYITGHYIFIHWVKQMLIQVSRSIHIINYPSF